MHKLPLLWTSHSSRVDQTVEKKTHNTNAVQPSIGEERESGFVDASMALEEMVQMNLPVVQQSPCLGYEDTCGAHEQKPRGRRLLGMF